MSKGDSAAAPRKQRQISTFVRADAIGIREGIDADDTSIVLEPLQRIWTLNLQGPLDLQRLSDGGQPRVIVYLEHKVRGGWSEYIKVALATLHPKSPVLCCGLPH